MYAHVSNSLLLVSDRNAGKLLESFYALKSAPARILCLSYTTIAEYMFFLRRILILLKEHGRCAIVFLGASVPPFFMPDNMRPAHKVISSHSRPTFELSHLPNVIPYLVSKYELENYLVMLKLGDTEAHVLQDLDKFVLRHGANIAVGESLSEEGSVHMIGASCEGRETGHLRKRLDCVSKKSCSSDYRTIAYMIADIITNSYDAWVNSK